jgi:hypothetical protein
MKRTVFGAFLCGAALLWSCGDAGSPDSGVQKAVDFGQVPDLSVSDAAVLPDGGTDLGDVLGCPANVQTCTSYNTRSYCVPGPAGPTWTTETCPVGCFQGKCSTTACADECVLGSSSPAGACKLWDLDAQAFITADPAGKLHDRARDYDQRLRQNNTPEGAVLNAWFTDQTFAQVKLYADTADSAIWTGSLLAAQSWRLIATGDPDAAAEVAAIVRTLHLFFNVSGDPGYLARLVLPSSANVPLEQASPCTDSEWHCNVSYDGQTYNWMGYISRDQNTGVMLGYYLAYLASPDEATRALIRKDVVALVTELMKVRKAVPTSVVLDGLPIDKPLDLENVVLAPSEMIGGKVQVQLSTSNTSDATIRGMREFLPDFGTLVQQVLGVAVPVPRASTAIMLGAFFQMGLLVTDGVPGMEAVHKQIADYYAAHADGWLTIAAGWKFTANCGNGYFANHIAFIMAYVYALEESNPSFAPRIHDTVLNSLMYGALKGHKNPYLTFLWGATRSPPAQADIDAAVTQLAGFQPGPRIHVARDLTAAAKYMPHDATCTNPIECDTATLATDVADRAIDGFLWQRSPWVLKDDGNPIELFPGVDYLAAYWVGRRYGFVSDDGAGTCTRYAP